MSAMKARRLILVQTLAITPERDAGVVRGSDAVPGNPNSMVLPGSAAGVFFLAYSATSSAAVVPGPRLQTIENTLQQQ